MQCSCGGQTEEREQVKKKEVVARYVRCEGCGRVHVYWRRDAVGNNRANHEDRGSAESLSTPPHAV